MISQKCMRVSILRRSEFSILKCLIVWTYLAVITITGTDAVGAPPASNDTFIKWRGRMKLTDLDMVEVATWVDGLAENFVESFKYYWVNNDLFYAYAGLVRAVFGVFKQEYKKDLVTNASINFMNGCEALIHYMVMKSFPTLGRRGGVRGNGQDRKTLRNATIPLKSCYETKSKLNFTTIFPSRRRRRKRTASAYEGEFFSRVKQSFKKLKARKWSTLFAYDSNEEDKTKKVDETNDSKSGEGKGLQKLFKLHGFRLGKTDSSSDETSNHNVRKRGRSQQELHSMLSGGGKGTIIAIRKKESWFENIAASVFWIMYEVVQRTCEFKKEELDIVKSGVEGILGRVLSLYMYDPMDYAEEYGRIFKSPVEVYEAEWTKIEGIARKLSKKKKFKMRRPYLS